MPGATAGFVEIAELKARHREISSSLRKLSPVELHAAADEMTTLDARIAELEVRKSSGILTVKATGRLWRDVWAEASIRERRELVRSALRPDGFLTIGPGVPGRKGFQLGRIRDREKLDGPPADYTRHDADIEIGELWSSAIADESEVSAEPT